MTATDHDRPMRGLTSRAWIALLTMLGVALIYAPRLAAAFTEAINWDEFTMLERADRTARLGQVFGGGRPGLVSLLLTPILKDCADAVSAALEARLVWQVIVIAYLLGLYVLVRRWFRFTQRPENGRLEGAAAVALLAFLPAFVTWSVQVRSDQPALAAAVWGGVCLLHGTPLAAAAAGLLFGVALLCTQKGLYAIALCMLLWATAASWRLMRAPAAAQRTEVRDRMLQLAVLIASTLGTLTTYAYLVPEAISLTGGGAVESSWQEMRRVRALLGYRSYVAELSRVPGHVMLAVALLAASVYSLRNRRRDDGLVLITAWLVLMLGAVVVAVHGASYPYFMMTAGLFPAVALGIASGRLASHLGRHRKPIIAATFLAIAAASMPITLELLHGSQANQRDTMHWLKESGLSARQGLQVDGALICLGDRNPFPPLSHRMNARGLSDGEAKNLIDEFRRRQIAYILDVGQLAYPRHLRDFWEENYQWAYGAVWVVGFEVNPSRRLTTPHVFVPGTYRWRPLPGNRGAVLEIDGRRVPAGGDVQLDVGTHSVTLDSPATKGTLVLDIKLPSTSQLYPFIDPVQLDRLFVRY